MAAIAQAQPNIALIKYWGKRDTKLNLPATGSLSITLAALWTRTRVEFDESLRHDELRLNGSQDPAARARTSACLDLLRRLAGTTTRARIDSCNNFPTAAGLASSASGFAALVVAADAELGLALDRRTLSALARHGSGSAARSLFGGFVSMAADHRADREDAVAEPLLDAAEWPLAVVVAVTSHTRKSVGSGAGMERSRHTSPFYPAWVSGAAADLTAACAAVQTRDFAALTAVSEHNCLKMHAVMQSSQPPLLYWSGTTLDCLQCLRALREREGVEVFFTSDAGAQVKAVCLPGAVTRVAAALADIPGVEQVLISGLGEGAQLVNDGEAI
ncbi:MAG: diphosphomevalonate decarboxylase [Rhodanobacter sp.]|nr:MAG: diphosphomevalonate decarboxylase [Rhodanobacter sp.]TAM40628.1 MAG: diphosphomevalonate decarboxylase [Rhodanobacter sp.]TAN25545.1 MAG: diphosphomevalonate decarboxylase [Rhodanobacter sp.]